MRALHLLPVTLLIKTGLLLPCLAGQVQSAPPAQVTGPNAAIHDIIHSETYRFSSPVIPANTDVDRDGITDVALFVSGNSGRLIRGGDLNVLFSGQGFTVGGLGPNGDLATEVLRASPINLGGQIAFLISGQAYNANFTQIIEYVAFWDHQAHNLLKKLFLPPRPPASPAPEHIYLSHSLGDLDGDNFDDSLVLFTGENAPNLHGAAIVDGATLSYKWSKYYTTPWASSYALFNTWPDPWQDIDGDGIKDFFSVVHSEYSPVSWYSRCISGADGSIIWEDVRPTGDSFISTSTASVVDDVNQDGIRDIFYWNNSNPWNLHKGYFRVQSGLDGSLIWEVQISDYDPQYSENPPSTSLRFEYTAMPTADIDGDGVKEIVIKGYYVIAAPAWDQDALYYLSGATGQLLSIDHSAPLSPYPWSDYWTMDGRAFFAGDIDNDGWAEFLNYTVAAGSDSITDIAIYGRSTLICPAETREGETVSFDLHIPTGAGKEFQVYLSTVFDAEDRGFHAGTWNTHLSLSPLLVASLFEPKLRGSLDQYGKGYISVRVPAGFGLAGREIFAVAVVEDPNMPSGVVTKSSVGLITVLP